MNVEATVDAIALLDRVRFMDGTFPTAVWLVLAHASDKLNQELAVYLNPEKAKA